MPYLNIFKQFERSNWRRNGRFRELLQSWDVLYYTVQPCGLSGGDLWSLCLVQVDIERKMCFLLALISLSGTKNLSMKNTSFKKCCNEKRLNAFMYH